MEASLHSGRKVNHLLAYLTSPGGSIQHNSLGLEGLSTGNVVGGPSAPEVLPRSEGPTPPYHHHHHEEEKTDYSCR